MLKSPWPSNALPPPTASLLSVASNKGLLAAAGPDSVIVASTEAVRQAFNSHSNIESDVQPFEPQLQLQLGTRISQVAFSADESSLVISAEVGGGLAVYDVQALLQGNTQSAFEMPTNGVGLRVLAPNPRPETAEFFAIVTTNGELMMANMKTRQFISGPQGQVMKEGVSCVSWSTRGKQLVAGLGNGTSFQMTPEGEGKAEIPRPPGLDGDQHGMNFSNHLTCFTADRSVSSISWLENNVFLTAHTPSSFDSDIAPATAFHIATRQTPPTFMFQRLPELCSPFGLNRSPPYHFIQRLKDLPPSIQDVLMVASTASTDIGMFTRSKEPLSTDVAAEKVTNVFTTTGAEDSRRAQMPMTEDLAETSPIGVALDLSSREKIKRPLPAEEFDESPTPLPALMVLNNEGVLATWWIVYADSIRQGTVYSGLAVVGDATQPPSTAQKQSSPFPNTSEQQKPAFGQSSANAPSPFGGLASTSAASAAPAFGSICKPGSSNAGAFGASSGLGNQNSPWSTTPKPGGSTFGQPSFSSSAQIGGPSQGAAFGASGALGKSSSPWGASPSSISAHTGSAFGQSSALGMRSGSALNPGAQGSVFAANPPATASSGIGSGFASFASGPGFAAAAAKSVGESPFGKATPGASFGSGMDTDSSFGGTTKKDDRKPIGLFGLSSGFDLGSTFKGDGSAKNDTPEQNDVTPNSLFGNNFGSALGEVTKSPEIPQIKEAEMASDAGDDDDALSSPQSPLSPIEQETTTPADTPGPSKFFAPDTVPPATSGLFGTQAQNKATPAAVQTSTPAAWSFSNTLLESTTPKQNPKKPEPTDHAPSNTQAQPVIKQEPVEETPSGISESITGNPLPPEPTSKTTYTPGDSSSSSTAASKTSGEDAPLPPDFLPLKAKPISKPAQETSEIQPELPSAPDDEGFDDEGSGVDVAQEISPTTDPDHSLKGTPESSFGAPVNRSSMSHLFPAINQQKPQQLPKPLFGEIGKSPAPFFPPPGKAQESPRSPSPVRSFGSGDVLRPETTRSVSAPGVPARGIINRKPTLGKPAVSSGLLRPESRPADIRKVEQARIAAQQAQKRAEEEQDLSDREDEKVREGLATEVEATTKLEPFVAHQDYVGNINKPGLPGQIEKVYRDINSMVDTLGINARSLEAFVKGHSEMYKDTGRSREDLESDDDWCLVEVEDLETVESSLAERLENGRLYDVQDKINQSRELQKELARIRAKHREMKKIVDAKSDPKQIDAVLATPLTTEQATLQHDLRKDFTRFQKLLVEAEQNIALLKAKIASHESGSSGEKGTSKVPTVEAVTNTILKMTGMVEKKSGDIDVLETQMKRLKMSSPLNGEILNGSRESSPFMTPPSSKRRGLRTPVSGASEQSAFYTPKSSLREDGRVSGKGALAEEDIIAWRERTGRRKDVCGKIKEAVVRNGFRVRGLDDG